VRAASAAEALDAELPGTAAKKNLGAVEPGVTVLKPTQVGGMRILRRSRERSWRNSASWPR